MISITCHCRNVTIEFDELPTCVRDCNCPVCNRLGALWADFMASDVDVTTGLPTATYTWGDGDYELHHCSVCGCTTHYSATDKSEKLDLGINLRMLDRKLLEKIPIVS